MRILILHLSDIHIKTQCDPILQRVESIVASLRNLEGDLHALVCVVSGDIVFSGAEEQYDLALEFLCSLKTKLEADFRPLECKFLIVPGNHDCDFREATAVRDSVLPKVLEKPALLLEPSHTTICLDPLKRFFDFRAAIDNLPESGASANIDSRFFSEHTLAIGEHTITFLCFNTAALSTLHEQPGKLLFPTTIIPPQRENDDAVIGVFHHPTNWLEPNCARTFRAKIEAISDIVLTGHEHTLDSRKVTSNHGDASYIEGGALQESGDSTISEFNVLVIDTATKQRRHVVFRWSAESYSPVGMASPDQLYLWQDFSVNSYRIRQTFRLRPTFALWLDDPEVCLTHRSKGQLTLGDVYVFPDLKRLNQPNERSREIVRSDAVPDLPLEKPHLFIVGDDESGKTALGKRLFLHLRSKGDIPVFVDLAKDRLATKTCAIDIENAFLRNYEDTSLDAFRQLDRARRVLIVDNYHRGKLPPRRRSELLNAIKQNCYRVIIFAHDIAITLYDLTESASSDNPFKFYSILPFSYTQQNRLIEKWLLLSENAENDTAPFVANLERMRRNMGAIFGKNYVYPFPPYMLAILQANESGTELDLKANTHGYFYELFIKQLIAKHSASSVAMNILTTYLSHVAYRVHVLGVRDIEQTEFRKLHNSLRDEFEVLPEFQQLADQLVAMQLLGKRNDSYRFRQAYIYYYFLALYLHQHLDDSEVTDVVQRLASELYKDESASTLLFLSHLTKDRRILDTLLHVCERQFASSNQACLDEDVNFVNELRAEIESLVLPNQTLAELRSQELERLEQQRQEEIEYEEKNQCELETHDTLLGQLNAAIKTIQILGQYLKNFPANLGKSEKDRIITAASGLAGRVLGECLSLLACNQIEAIKEMILLIGRHRPNLSEDKLRVKAVNALVSLSELVATGMILRLAQSLGSQELMVTYERYFGDQPNGFRQLTHLALKLDHNEAFPEAFVSSMCESKVTNAFVFRLIQNLVARRVVMFPTDFRLKQKLSALLKLEYKPLQLAKPEQRLLR